MSEPKLTIEVLCLSRLSQRKLNILFKNIVGVGVGIDELRQIGYRTEKDMLVLFPPDMMKYGLGSDILIRVTGLKEHENTEHKIRRLLAGELVEVVQKSVPTAEVNCRVSPPNSEDVHASLPAILKKRRAEKPKTVA